MSSTEQQPRFRDDIWMEYVEECEHEETAATREDFETYLAAAYVPVSGTEGRDDSDVLYVLRSWLGGNA